MPETRARDTAEAVATLATKADYAMPVDNESGATYTFTLSNATQLVAASNASTKTFTVPPQSSITWAADTILRVVNYGAGALTIAGGAGVTVTNAATTIAQYQSAFIIRTGSDAWTLVPFAGGSSATLTGFTSSTTYSVPAGRRTMQVLVVGGGSGGGSNGTTNDVVYYVGGKGGAVTTQTVSVTAGETLTITIGAGGGGGANGTTSSIVGSFGTVSAAGGTTRAEGGANGTYVTGWGWYGGSGPYVQFGGSQPGYGPIGAGGAGKGGGPNGVGAQAGDANTGGGGSGGGYSSSTAGGSGFVGVLVY